jgi:UDP-galactopyranose mutase
MKKAIIIGAGFTGLTHALLLRRKGWQVTIIERDGFLGGGCRTFFHGGHPFTYGPRHFLSPHPEAYEFLTAFVPLRDLKKMNYTFIERDQTFYTYPPHEEDIAKMPDRDSILAELAALPEEGANSTNYEEFYLNRLGPTLYEKYSKHYNKKAWMLHSNKEMDFGYEITVKRKSLESGDRCEFRDWFNCYPVPLDGYNGYFDVCAEGCEVLLNTTAEAYDLEHRRVRLPDRTIEADILISSISPDDIMERQYGELRYVGRDFYKIVLPVEQVLPENVYFVYYPNESETHTRVVEFKKFTQYQSPFSLITLEVPSMKNKLYPMLLNCEVDRAQKYLDALPANVFSVGRMGRYRYLDIDDIILEAKRFVEDL